MMTQVLLPERLEGEEHSLAFYLAMEEYIAHKFTAGDYFFVWRTGPSVIFGRNQSLESEVNLEYCREHDIKVYRRKSGGGCVYSDMGNLMHSCITSPEGDSAFVFHRYMQWMSLALSRLGLDARVSGRNDITVGGRKVSGNAFHLLPRRCIIHGTLLFGTDLDALEQAINPPVEKLVRRGISSVRQRVTNLGEMLDMDMDAFAGHIVSSMCDGSVTLDAGDVTSIEEMSQEYLQESFLTGRNPKH